ncbi:hypothetical protein D3C84_924850 [compost metagenome]
MDQAFAALVNFRFQRCERFRISAANMANAAACPADADRHGQLQILLHALLNFRAQPVYNAPRQLIAAQQPDQMVEFTVADKPGRPR